MEATNDHNSRPFFLVSLFILIIAISGCAGSGHVEIEEFNTSTFKFINRPELVSTELTEDITPLIGEAMIGNDSRPVINMGETYVLRFQPDLIAAQNNTFSFAYGLSEDAFRYGRQFYLTGKLIKTDREIPLGEIIIQSRGAKAAGWTDVSWSLPSPMSNEYAIEVRFSGATDPNDGLLRIAHPTLRTGIKTPPQRFFLVAVDSLRADHLSCYGYDRMTSPNLDAFANQSIRYSRCISTSPWTYPSFGAMFTGRYPSVAGAVTNVKFLQESEDTLAEILSLYGFSTLSIVNNPWVGVTTNLDQGFDTTIEFPHQKASVAFDEAIRWSKLHTEENQFIFIHLMDPHLPYSPKPENLGKFMPEGYTGEYVNEFDMTPKDIEALRDGKIDISEPDRERIESLYDEEIFGFDQDFAAFIAELKNLDAYDDSLIIVTADHGEEFWEHGAFGHGHQLYDEVLHVPLIVKERGEDRGLVIDEPVSQIDILPMILTSLQMEIPDDINGMPAQIGNPANLSGRNILSEQLCFGVEQRGITTPSYRYLIHTIDSSEELYDVQADPEMTVNLAEKMPDISRSYRYLLKEYVLKYNAGWNILFTRNASSAYGHTFALRLSAPGGFESYDSYGFGESDVFSESDDSLFVNVSVGIGEEKSITFSTPDEDTKVSFELTVDGEMKHHDTVFLGPEKIPFPYTNFKLKITDDRFGLGIPNFSEGQYPGLFIWGNSQGLSEEMPLAIGDEIREEVGALGIFQ